jgi:hypothetical protein
MFNLKFAMPSNAIRFAGVARLHCFKHPLLWRRLFHDSCGHLSNEAQFNGQFTSPRHATMAEQHPIITPEEFQTQFLLLQAKLKSYLFRLTASRQDADDLAQDTYLKAASNLAGFAGKSTLKTWLFTIATNLARDHSKAQCRWREDTQDRCREDTRASPQKVARMRAELVRRLDPLNAPGAALHEYLLELMPESVR